MTAKIKYLLLAALVLLGACASVPGDGGQARLNAAAAAAYDYGQARFNPVVARHAMVVSEQALATEVGVQVLRQGGNAVDAAVAVGFALAVVLPNAGNLGGGGFMLLHEGAGAQTYALDFREQAPAAATRDMFLDASGAITPGASLFSHRAAGVPGTVAGLLLAHERWGSVPLAELLAPAIKLAEDGFVIDAGLAKALAANAKYMQPWAASRAIFWNGDQPRQAGELLVQADLGRSLRAIAADGARAFYHGAIAARIVAEMQRHAGLISAEDLAGYQARWREPLQADYRGVRVYSMPPPSSGGLHLLQILQMLEPLPLATMGAGSAQSIHYLSEAMRRAYADRARYLGDPDFVAVPVAALLDRGYLRARMASVQAMRATSSSAIAAGELAPYESDQTTHFSIADSAGNAVALTYTLNTNFGSGIVVPGTGILLNNQMDDFSSKPGAPNVYGLIGAQANAIAGGKRPLSSMTPTIVLKNGKPWLITGSPGGARIISTVAQAIINAVDFGMNPAEAAASPRMHHQWLPDEIRVESGFSPDTLQILRGYGHKVVQRAPMGKLNTIQIEGGEFWGAADLRAHAGLAAGF